MLIAEVSSKPEETNRTMRCKGLMLPSQSCEVRIILQSLYYNIVHCTECVKFVSLGGGASWMEGLSPGGSERVWEEGMKSF